MRIRHTYCLNVLGKDMTDLGRAVQEILNAAMFENWLRFYFIVEKKAESGDEPELIMTIPEKSINKISELYPQYLDLAEKLNGQPVDFNTSRAAVLTYVAEKLDGVDFPRGLAAKAIDSQEFQLKLQLFHIWTQLHEEQLDQGFLDFGSWLRLFGEWLSGPAAKKLEATMKEANAQI